MCIYTYIYIYIQRERERDTCIHMCIYVYMCIYLYICSGPPGTTLSDPDLHCLTRLSGSNKLISGINLPEKQRGIRFHPIQDLQQYYRCPSKKQLRRNRRMGRHAFIGPHQGLESSFCCKIA